MKILAQQLARTNPEQAAKVMQAATALEQKQGQQKALEGLFTGEVQTPEALMTAGQQALAAGDPQTALALRDKAQGLSKTEATRQSETAAIQQELQGYMTNPEASPEVKRMANQIYRGFVGGGMQPAAIAQQLSALRDLAKPRAVGSRAAPKEVEVMEKQPDGSMKRVTKFALQDPVTGELTYERVGLTPPKEFAPSDISGAKKGDVARSARSPWEDMNEVAATSSISLIRNKNLATQIASEPDKATGLVSQVRTKVLDIAGLRDAEENLKTEFLRGVNTEIIGSLPPGVASDRDIEIFSSGFPDDSRSTQQILEYLEVERRFLGALQDKALLAEQFLDKQMQKGQDGNFVGFNAYQRGYSTAMTNLGMNIKEEVAKGADPVQAQQRHMAAFKQAFGFTPAYYL
tara:strand:- start:2326 stop:3537 length:1212 start_codon:yes stop_codon:yes gene_type:complete